MLLQKVKATGAKRRPFLTLCSFSPKRLNPVYREVGCPAPAIYCHKNVVLFRFVGFLLNFLADLP